MEDMRGISRRSVISAGVAALACAPLAGGALAGGAHAAEGDVSLRADARGGSGAAVAPAVAGTPEALDATLVVGGMTLACPSAWRQQSTGDRAFTLTDAAGNVCHVSTLEAQIDMTSDATMATSLLGAFAAQIAAIDESDAAGAPHYLSAVVRDDTDGVVSGSVSTVSWAAGELWNGRAYVAGDGTTTYAVDGTVRSTSDAAPTFLATMDAVWAARSIVPAAPVDQAAATAAAAPAAAATAQTTSNPDAEYLVTIDDCTLTADYSGSQAVIITFTFTNNSNEPKSFATATIVNVYQDGVEQDTAIVTDIDTSNYLNKVKPGASATVQMAYEAPSMSDVEVEVSTFSFLSSKTLATATFPLV